MFTHSSDIYDLVYSFKDYEKESAEIRNLIHKLRPGCKRILDVGCGTAEHHKHLGKQYAIEGIDLNKTFIESAKRKNPAGEYSVADMKAFSLGKQYDVVTCLFSSIGYLQSTEEIAAALKCFHAHLQPGGLALVEPWFTAGSAHSAKANMLTYDKEGIKICRMSRSHVSGDFSILNFHYLVGMENESIRHFSEEHRLRLSSTEEMLHAFSLAGFEANFEEKGLIGRGMYYGVKK